MAYYLKYSLLWKLRFAVFLRLKIQAPTHQNVLTTVWACGVEEGGSSHFDSATMEQTAEGEQVGEPSGWGAERGMLGPVSHPKGPYPVAV